MLKTPLPAHRVHPQSTDPTGPTDCATVGGADGIGVAGGTFSDSRTIASLVLVPSRGHRSWQCYSNVKVPPWL